MRLRITGASTSSPQRWRALAQRALSLDAGEADRALASPPLLLTLAPPVDDKRIAAELGAIALEAQLEPPAGTHERCPRHARLLESDICPQCGERACTACVRLTAEKSCPRCVRSKGRWTTFRRARIAVLLLVLLGVATATWLDARRFASWKAPVQVVLHPVVAEDGPEIEAYVRSLDAERFSTVAEFIDAEARRYGTNVVPRAITIELGPEVRERIARVPTEGGVLTAMRWSIGFRWWVWRTEEKLELPPADVRMFVQYWGATANRSLDHSTGIERARAGIVNLFASVDQEGPNAVVLAHEIFHTLGATDKYGPGGEPAALGDPAQSPLYPQARAEIMAGRIAVSQTQSKMPESLQTCVVNEVTAQEIGWVSP